MNSVIDTDAYLAPRNDLLRSMKFRKKLGKVYSKQVKESRRLLKKVKGPEDMFSYLAAIKPHQRAMRIKKALRMQKGKVQRGYR